MNIQDKEVIREILNYYGFTFNEILSSRKAGVIKCKFVIYYVMTALGNSSTTVGRMVKKDHTTILWGIRSVKNNPELRKVASKFFHKALDNGYKPNILPKLNHLATKNHENYKKSLYIPCDLVKRDEELFKLLFNSNCEPDYMAQKLCTSIADVNKKIEDYKKSGRIKKVCDYDKGLTKYVFLEKD